MRVYSFTLESGAVSGAAKDLFQLEAQSVPAKIIGVEFGVHSADYGDSEAEGLRVTLNRSITDVITDGVTELAVDGGDSTANAKLNTNQAEATTGRASFYATGWNIQIPFIWMPPPELRETISVGEAFTVNITQPTDEITVSGVVWFSEEGA